MILRPVPAGHVRLLLAIPAPTVASALQALPHDLRRDVVSANEFASHDRLSTFGEPERAASAEGRPARHARQAIELVLKAPHVPAALDVLPAQLESTIVEITVGVDLGTAIAADIEDSPIFAEFRAMTKEAREMAREQVDALKRVATLLERDHARESADKNAERARLHEAETRAPRR
jgi:hypothetical protein